MAAGGISERASQLLRARRVGCSARSGLLHPPARIELSRDSGHQGLTTIGSSTLVTPGAALHCIKGRGRDVAAKLVAGAERLRADLMVTRGYGHSRLREYLLGGVTYDLLHEAPVPLVIAH